MVERRMAQAAIIIPAFNEASRIGKVLRAVLQCKLASEVVVVCDGCTDSTAAIATGIAGVKVVVLPTNQGKGAAMAAGAAATTAEVVAFVDADLDGLRGEHVDAIIEPVLARRCEMCVGLFRGGRIWSDAAHRITPYLSGQRAVRRDLLKQVPYLAELRLGAEMALTQAARRRGWRVLRVSLAGVSNCHKETKYGIVRGTAARAKMYVEIGQAMVRSHPKRPKAHRSPFTRWRA